MDTIIIRFRQAESGQRVLYVVAVAISLLLLIALLTNLPRHGEVPAMSARVGEQPPVTAQPRLTVAPVTSVPTGSEIKANSAIHAHSPTMAKPGIKKNVESKIAKEISRDKPKDKPQDKLDDKSKHSENLAKVIDKDNTESNEAVATSSGSADAYISVTCMEGTEVFVDGIRKGRVGYSPLTVVISPGKHMVIVSHTSRGIFTQSVELNSGKTVHIKPSLCN